MHEGMPGETKLDISGWTTDTLKVYVERLFEEHDKRYEQRFNAQKEALESALDSATRAVDKAEAIAEKWRQNANEWRAAMSDRDKAYLTKEAADIKFSSLDKMINDNTRRIDAMDNRGAGLHAGWGYLVGAFGVGLTIAMIIFYVISTLKMVGH